MKFINAIRKFISNLIALVALTAGALVAIPFIVLIIIADWINPTKKDERLSNEEFQKRVRVLTSKLQQAMK
ncbi:hypothetical protein CPT_Metamorpho_232 [Klebsiella phage Metamorpho]|nr:hypothetical protein CPT_Metamorpho_232 [Klebsiella phage Metamorpho]